MTKFYVSYMNFGLHTRARSCLGLEYGRAYDVRMASNSHEFYFLSISFLLSGHLYIPSGASMQPLHLSRDGSP